MSIAAALVGGTLNTTSLASRRLAGRGAFALFSTPLRRGRLRPAELDQIAGARTATMTVEGKSVRTYRWGSGERPILFVHGWWSRGSRVAPLVPGLLARGYSPISFDAPGHGESGGRSTTIMEYREIIRRLHAEYGDFEAIVAHSFGVAASFYALRDEVRAGRLVGVSGVGEFGYLLEKFSGHLKLRDRVSGELRRLIEDGLFPGRPDIWRNFSATHRPEEFDLPILLIHDDGDSMVLPEQSRRIAAAHGDRVRLIVTNGLGHNKILADPGVVDTVLHFLDS
ncbi:alpha/beta hydrolase [Phytomonospora sp. NPDC050363]|uniref:alpha/beta hydrolase n=1 Tax=Phytomonospora sp. NPDC050363 TaxID=3155642 RepID=UPI0033C966C6